MWWSSRGTVTLRAWHRYDPGTRCVRSTLCWCSVATLRGAIPPTAAYTKASFVCLYLEHLIAAISGFVTSFCAALPGYWRGSCLCRRRHHVAWWDVAGMLSFRWRLIRNQTRRSRTPARGCTHSKSRRCSTIRGTRSWRHRRRVGRRWCASCGWRSRRSAGRRVRTTGGSRRSTRRRRLRTGG